MRSVPPEANRSAIGKCLARSAGVCDTRVVSETGEKTVDEFYSVSGARETFASGVRAMARGDFATADRLATSLADSTAQGDSDTVYAAMYATYREETS